MMTGRDQMSGTKTPLSVLEPKSNKPRKWGVNLFSWFVSFLIYMLIIALVTSVYLLGTQDGSPRILLGYSMFIVLSSSMQSEIPQGSYVLVKTVDQYEISIGDDVTYMRQDKVAVTHRVVDILEDYKDSGMRGFKTKGLQNAEPDSAIVYADWVVGKVVFHNLSLGRLLTWLRANFWFVAVFAVAFTAFVTILSYLIKTGKKHIPTQQSESNETEVSPGQQDKRTVCKTDTKSEKHTLRKRKHTKEGSD